MIPKIHGLIYQNCNKAEEEVKLIISKTKQVNIK
jgi:hypothetical protein